MSRSKVGRILREQEGFGIERVQDHHFSLKGYDEGSDHWEILREKERLQRCVRILPGR